MKRFMLSIILLMVFPLAAAAHVYMLGMSPAEKAELSESPAKVTIEFAGSVEPAFSKIEVFDSSGKMVSKKTRFLNRDMIMEADIDGTLSPGVYTVKWRCMSLDGHSQTGEYSFTIR